MEDGDDYYPPRRNGAGRIIVTIVVVAAAAVIALGVEKRYRVVEHIEAALRGGPAETEADPRAAAFLTDGEHALVTGDLTAAQSAFDEKRKRAHQLRDSRVSVDLVAGRCGQGRRRLARAASAFPRCPRRGPRGPHRAQRPRLRRRAQRAGRRQRAPRLDPQAIAAKIDSLRLAGQADAARGLVVVAVYGKATEPETARRTSSLRSR